jgi:hypothetical protein
VASNFKGCTNGFPVTVGGQQVTVTRVTAPEVVPLTAPPSNGKLITQTATCPAGTALVGGGGIGFADAASNNIQGGVPLTEDAPAVPALGSPSTTWVAGVWETPTAADPGVGAYALCAN